MIKTKTVFVLGAGAHHPYGLPIGSSLIQKIVEMLPTKVNDNSNSFRDSFFEIYGSTFGSIDNILMNFRHKLSLTGHRSIDSFLAAYASQEGFPEVGKLAVATVLLPLEFLHKFSLLDRKNPDQDWMSFLFSHMLEGCVNKPIEHFLESNSVSFVTFNYDRTLEYLLNVRLVNSFGITTKLALERVKQFPIVHVYGSLGEFNTAALSRKEATISHRSGHPMPFLPSEFHEAAKSIRLMYDDRVGDEFIAGAKNEIATAKVVIFLGFGFDPDNISRLELNNNCVGKLLVGATRYQVAEGDWTRTITAMNPTGINVQGNRQWDSLTFLHETNMFR
jgi:hypothetical protein